MVVEVVAVEAHLSDEVEHERAEAHGELVGQVARVVVDERVVRHEQQVVLELGQQAVLAPLEARADRAERMNYLL